jgi:hypothetical protein
MQREIVADEFQPRTFGEFMLHDCAISACVDEETTSDWRRNRLTSLAKRLFLGRRDREVGVDYRAVKSQGAVVAIELKDEALPDIGAALPGGE